MTTVAINEKFFGAQGMAMTKSMRAAKKLLGLGFGANIGGVLSHCFQLNGNARKLSDHNEFFMFIVHYKMFVLK